MVMLKKLKRLLTNSEGQVAVIVSLLIVSFIGMTALVVDMGSLYEDRRSLQSVADAAVLAGAQELPLSQSKATQEATDYVTKNRADIDSINIEIGSTLATDDTIKVTVYNPDSPISFGRVYGLNSANVAATATAMVGKPQSFTGVVPWGVIQNKWVPGVEYPLNEDKFGSLSFNGESTGGSVYRDNIANGYSGTLEIGSTVEFLQGFKSGPTIQGTESRIGPPPLDTFSKLTVLLAGGGYGLAKPDSQFVMVPIVSQSTSDIGHGPIIGFAPFVITYNTNKIVYGTFLNEALLVYTGSILAVDYTGIKVIRMIE
jgi:Flp pilus assembly protein TadG